MIIGLLETEEGCSSDILYVLNDKSELDWSKYEKYSDLTKQLAPEILEYCDIEQLEKFKQEWSRNLEYCVYDYEIPGKIDVPFVDEEIIKNYCKIDDAALIEEFDSCRGIFKNPEDWKYRDKLSTRKEWNKYQRKAGLNSFF